MRSKCHPHRGWHGAGRSAAPEVARTTYLRICAGGCEPESEAPCYGQKRKCYDAGDSSHAASVCALASLADRIGAFTGQSMPMAGSLHKMPDSAFGLYVPVHLYWISATSDNTQKPRANPAGAHTCFLFSADTSTPNHRP